MNREKKKGMVRHIFVFSQVLKVLKECQNPSESFKISEKNYEIRRKTTRDIFEKQNIYFSLGNARIKLIDICCMFVIRGSFSIADSS